LWLCSLSVSAEQRGPQLTAVVRTISTSGAYSWSYKPARRGSYRLRVTIGKTTGATAASTTWRTFKVK
jgi:hypothetical protein